MKKVREADSSQLVTRPLDEAEIQKTFETLRLGTSDQRQAFEVFSEVDDDWPNIHTTVWFKSQVTTASGLYEVD